MSDPGALERTLQAFDGAARLYVERAAKMIESLDADSGPRLSRSLESWGCGYGPDGFPRDPDDPLYVNQNGLSAVPATGYLLDERTVPYLTEEELTQIRRYCRWLAKSNPFAECGHGNRQTYIVGEGFVYKVVAKPNEDVSEEQLQAAQDILDEWLRLNRWCHRQSEIILRNDRDGETFLRKSLPADGILRVRFVEPAAVTAPPDATPLQSFGIETDPEDGETVLRYFVADGTGAVQAVDAAEIQHRKRNVDSGCKRGMPLFWSIRGHLQRAVKVLRNMSTTSEIQTAIAMIRKHVQATQTTVRAFVAGQADQTRINAVTGRTDYARRYDPGTIIDAPQGTDYEFPAQGVDPTKHVTSVQAELRAAAAALKMPEFMFTADASNANFSSTMIAEGPAVKNFRFLQWVEVEDDKALIREALELAAVRGLLPFDLVDQIDIDVQPPPVQVRDRLKDAQTAQILLDEKIVSPQTVAGEFGYEYDKEQENIEQHQDKYGLPMGNLLPLPGMPGSPGLPPHGQPPGNDPHPGDPAPPKGAADGGDPPQTNPTAAEQ